jgi:hypothetical protein
MSHLHNFSCPTEYSHYQSRGMCKIPNLSTFPSKPYEPRDMKGNFGKFPHWDTSESSMWWFELNWLCRRLVIPPGQNLLRVLWMYAHEIIFRSPGTSSTPFTLSSHARGFYKARLTFYLTQNFVLHCQETYRYARYILWTVRYMVVLQPKRQGSRFTSGFSSASQEVQSKSCHRTYV